MGCRKLRMPRTFSSKDKPLGLIVCMQGRELRNACTLRQGNGYKGVTFAAAEPALQYLINRTNYWGGY